ncbi:STAS domain-containing protein [Actinoplanes sp. URMC 104]|uniref:STAS domain-containing protein n=1 Tax=Actinoplanes sp. URMC 104 TaxID=3423409 RepID=UPI003F1DECAF
MYDFERNTQSMFTVEVTRQGDATLGVAVRGEVDMATASQLQATVTGAIDRQAPKHVVIDVAAMPFLDAAGITALVAIRRYAVARHADVRMENVQPLVKNVLHIVDLANVLHISP